MKNSKNSIIAKRYAKSLIEINKEDKVSYDVIQNSLNNTKEILNSSKELFEVLNNPIVSAVDKEEIVNSVFQNDTDEITRNFLKLLINKNRFSAIYDIIEEYNDEVDIVKNIKKVDVISAVELNDNKKAEIQNKLKEKLNKEINITYTLDKSVIAGLIYKIGDNVIDTSLAHKMEKFKKEIIK